MATLRKSDLSGRIAAKMGGSKAKGEAALRSVLESVEEALANGDRVVLTGFGSGVTAYPESGRSSSSAKRNAAL